MSTARTIRITAKSIGKASDEAIDVDIPESLGMLDDAHAAPDGCGMFRILTPQDGDKRVVWDSRDLRQINDAKDIFNDLVEEGLRPYRVDPSGRRSPEIMDEFDPSAEEIYFAPDQAPILAGG